MEDFDIACGNAEAMDGFQVPRAFAFLIAG